MEDKSYSTEFVINMYLEKLLILQQSDLELLNNENYFDLNYFNGNSPCHIYFICKRSRITVDYTKFKVTDKYLYFTFKIQKQEKFTEIKIKKHNCFNTKNIQLRSDYPYSLFSLYSNNELLYQAKSALFLQETSRNITKSNETDLEVIYIGQSYGVDGARTAPERLKNHSTLQFIYSQSMERNPDCEIWIMLTSFQQINIMMMDGRKKFTVEEYELDKNRLINVFYKLNYEGIEEQQKINFTEAALIKYFKPKYNKEYKNTFPNPAHVTYSQCYDLDINLVSVELETLEAANILLYSEEVERSIVHIGKFPLNSCMDRQNMFEFPF